MCGLGFSNPPLVGPTGREMKHSTNAELRRKISRNLGRWPSPKAGWQWIHKTQRNCSIGHVSSFKIGVNGCFFFFFSGNQWGIILEFPLWKSKINRWCFVIDLFLRYYWAPRLVCVWIRIFLKFNQSYRGGWMAFLYDRWGAILERQNRQQHCVAVPNDEFDPSKGLGTYTALTYTFVSSFCRSNLF